MKSVNFEIINAKCQKLSGNVNLHSLLGTLYLLVKGTVGVILSDHSCKRWEYPINKSTLKTLSHQVWIWYPCFFYLSTVYFHLTFLGKSKHFFQLQEEMENIRINHCLSSENNDIFHIIDQIKVLRIQLWIGNCHFFMKGHLKLHLQSLVLFPGRAISKTSGREQ